MWVINLVGMERMTHHWGSLSQMLSELDLIQTKLSAHMSISGTDTHTHTQKKKKKSTKI